jgi:hypothetical protein
MKELDISLLRQKDQFKQVILDLSMDAEPRLSHVSTFPSKKGEVTVVFTKEQETANGLVPEEMAAFIIEEKEKDGHRVVFRRSFSANGHPKISHGVSIARFTTPEGKTVDLRSGQGHLENMLLSDYPEPVKLVLFEEYQRHLELTEEERNAEILETLDSVYLNNVGKANRAAVDWEFIKQQREE